MPATSGTCTPVRCRRVTEPLPGYTCALGDPVVQLRYATALRAMAARQARISAGTFLARIAADRRSVRQMLDACDVFVCSASEAIVLAGVGQLVDALAWLARSVGGSGRAVAVRCSVLSSR